MLGDIFARNSKETAGLTLSQVKTTTASTIKSKLNPSIYTNTDKLLQKICAETARHT